jgi:prepilin-type N-terminal cleavage/methylation domain-containing protein
MESARHAAAKSRNDEMMNNSTISLRRRTRDESGFTLIEIMISLVVLTVIMTAIFEFFMSSQVAFDHEMAQSGLDAKARHLADEMSTELNFAYVQASPSDADAEVEFQKVIGITTDGSFTPIVGNDEDIKTAPTTGGGTVCYGVLNNTLFRREWKSGALL